MYHEIADNPREGGIIFLKDPLKSQKEVTASQAFSPNLGAGGGRHIWDSDIWARFGVRSRCCNLVAESSPFHPVQSNRVCALGSSPGVLEEAEFYNIASLVRLVKERIRDNENRTSQVMNLWLQSHFCGTRGRAWLQTLAAALVWFSRNRGINAVRWMQGMARKEPPVWLYKVQSTESSQQHRERQGTLTGEGPGPKMGGFK